MPVITASNGFHSRSWWPCLSVKWRLWKPAGKLDSTCEERRACLHDLLTSKPGAFASESDVQSMMQMFPLDR
jgi:hypothetical protein